MAGTKKASGGKKASRKKAAPKPPPEERIISAAMSLAAEHGWRRLTLSDIAKEAGLPVEEVQSLFQSKSQILKAVVKQADERMMATEFDDDEAIRDRLFELVMCRFDALAPHKAGIAAIARETIRDPAAALCSGPGVICAMRRTLGAAGVGTGGLIGMLRVKAMTALYLDCLRIWLADDSEDSARTMAALDKRLRMAERAEQLCRPPARDRGETAAA